MILKATSQNQAIKECFYLSIQSRNFWLQSHVTIATIWKP